jgi:hypothetical protein
MNYNSLKLPITIALPVNATMKIALTCDNAKFKPSTVNITAVAMKGKLREIGDVEIVSVPFPLQSERIQYFAPDSVVDDSYDYFNFSCECNGTIEDGYVHITLLSSFVAKEISASILQNTASKIFLSGTDDVNGYLQPVVTSLPLYGQFGKQIYLTQRYIRQFYRYPPE